MDTRTPEYYRGKAFDVIDFLEEQSSEGAAWFCRGSVIKYATRAGRKGSAKDAQEDCEKIAVFADRLARILDHRASSGDPVTHINRPASL